MADNSSNNNTQLSFRDTLNLPHTDFPIRSNSRVDDPAMIERWVKEDLFHVSYTHNEGKPKYIYHDGPPYANGNIHIGHVYNKTLKDIVTKSQRMQGKHVPVLPGWDCHGLPIEIKVTQENAALQGVELKKACRAYAQKWVDIQKEEFKNLGILMDWDHYYSTMDYAYEAAVIQAFGHFASNGYINRSNKTIPWCFSCKTVLALAEIEYKDRKDPSVYVLFPLVGDSVQAMFPGLESQKISFVVWTTTPWTLPLNRAVLLKPQTPYVILNVQGQYLIVGEALADKLCAMLGVEKTVVETFVSDDLVACLARAHHPFNGGDVPILLDDSVLTEDGTACVHNAPGAGPIDYEIGVKNGLEIYSPIADDGTYTQEIEPKELIGMPVTEGQWWVLKKLKEEGLLLHKATITHSYPHCWRCHNGLIFRATKQWFFDLQAHALKDRALQEIETVESYPEKSINRLKTMVRSRFEWCLSRQRSWGVPIPALLCAQCDEAYCSQELAEIISDHVAKHGIEWWDTVPVEQLIDHDTICKRCKSKTFVKEKDIVDVWLESGLSHYAVLDRHAELGVPADLYLEGSDQHRAWFQSSLLTSVALYNKAPYRALFTHGFVVDEKGHKMSKSLGNVIAPQELLERFGIDGVRMWVASLDNDGEAVLSETLLKNVQEVFRKIRNTLRFLLSNLYDFDIYTNAVPVEGLQALDLHALQELSEVNEAVIDCYNAYNITGVFHKLSEYCASNLSALYLDIIKDRLYVEKADGHARRSAQTVCWYIVDTLTRLIAPILSCTAEQISDLYQKNKKKSIHLQNFVHLKDMFTVLAERDAPYHAYLGPSGVTHHRIGIKTTLNAIHTLTFAGFVHQDWEIGFELRNALLKAIEEARENGLVKHPREVRMSIYINPQVATYNAIKAFFDRIESSNQTIESFLKEFLLVSQCVVLPAKSDLQESSVFEGLYVKIEHARGEKCPRCWQWSEAVAEYGVCDRCYPIVKELKGN